MPRLPRSLLDSLNVLSVPEAEAKLQAILQGIDCGLLPHRLAAPHIEAGRLVSLRVETPRPPLQDNLTWRASENGRALRWWIKRLTDPGLAESLFY